MRGYVRMISAIDQAIGRFIEALEEAGLADNTIIVSTADNGSFAGNRGIQYRGPTSTSTSTSTLSPATSATWSPTIPVTTACSMRRRAGVQSRPAEPIRERA